MFLLVYLFLAVGVLAQSPIVKVDINMSGRSEAECNDPNYTPWIPDNAASISKSVNGITFTFAKVGTGEALRATYYKAGVQAPYYARLGCDGMYVDGGNSGARIDLTLSGLASGSHSLMAFHNAIDSPDNNNFSPIDVYVNNSKVISNLVPSERALTTDVLQSSYVTFTATAGQNVVISYRAVTSGSQNMKNVYINGFELNTPNVKNQAKNPSPTDGDLHVNADNGSATLSWTSGSGAVAHRVFFGTDITTVTNATTSSAAYLGQQSGTSYTVSNLYNLDTYYWRVDEVTSGGVVTKGNTWVFRKRQLAFPGAEGYGRYAIGGRGGKVVHVTNLNDSGAGSLRDAVENQTGPRTIVFDVSGVIALNSRLVISDPYVTIAGQTAPGKGICIRKAPMGFTGNDLIARHTKVRLGAGPTFDGMGMTGANHSILDHCSISWTIDESFSSRGSKNITLQRTLISEALNAANHQNYPAGTEHGYAATIGGDIGSFHHNLLAHNYGRNWSLGGGLDGNNLYAGRLDITNNVVYNWGGRTTDGGAHEVNFVNNYYKPGAGSKIFVALSMDHENNGPGTQRAYFSGNVMPGHFNESNQAAGRRETFSNGDYKKYECFVTSPFFSNYITTQSATDAYKSVLSDVGQTQPVFDDHDIRMVEETLNGTYKYKGSVTGKPGFPDKESDVGGYENYPNITRASNWDSDKDGLPDFWERMIGTNPNSGVNDFSDSNGDPDRDGYTYLEDYLNWMAETHYFVSYGGTQTIDLTAMFKGYSKSNPSYTVSNVENGTVSISGSTATFTAKNCGFASFNLKVIDNVGASMTKKIGVFVESATPGQCTLKVYDCAGVEEGTAILDSCGVCTGGTTGMTACSGALQGESFCDALGVLEASNTGFIGEGYLNFDNAIGSNGNWNLNATTAGTYKIGLRYANGGNTNRSMTLSVNATNQGTFTGAPTGGWTTWKTEFVDLSLTAGVNNIVLTATSEDGGPNVDLLSFRSTSLQAGGCIADCNGVLGGAAFTDECSVCVGGNTNKTPCVQDCKGTWGGGAQTDACGVCLVGNSIKACVGSLEAETACEVLGVLSENKNEGFSGEGYVNVDNAIGTYASWVLNSDANQTATISFRYANGGTTSRDGVLTINGTDAGNVVLAPTGAWTTWEISSVNVDLNQGANELLLTATTADGLANIDLISFSTGVSDANCLITNVNNSVKTTRDLIYPNPTHGLLTIPEGEKWKLLNVIGVEIQSGENQKTIDLTNYSTGVYYLIVGDETHKIIKD